MYSLTNDSALKYLTSSPILLLISAWFPSHGLLFPLAFPFTPNPASALCPEKLPSELRSLPGSCTTSVCF